MSAIAARIGRIDLIHVAGLVAGAIGVVVLAGLAAQVDAAAPGASVATTALDLSVGLAFILGAALAPGERRARAVMAIVGVAWLVAPYLPGAPLAYLGVLAVGMTVFPAGRPRTAAAWLLICVAVPVLLVPIPKPLLALFFGAVAAYAATRADTSGAWYPIAAGMGLAAGLALSWVVELEPDRYDPLVWQVALEVVLLAIAIGFPVAMRAVVGARAGLADRVLGDDRLVGLDGLATVLRDVLNDSSLELYRWDIDREAYVGLHGDPAPIARADGWMVVRDRTDPLGAVAHRALALEEPAIAEAVARAVRLEVLNVRGREALDLQLADLEGARGRLLATTDRQRAAIASRLRDEVVGPLRRAGAGLTAATADEAKDDAVEALTVAREELEAAADEILHLVGGVPPARLGDGGLVEAIRGLAARCPVPVTVSSAPLATGTSEAETTLFYVCSEAITNAVKHANASQITVAINADPRFLVARVSDDGVGGARPSGSGIQGLADRLAARGGRLRVDSPPGAGTTLTAEIPR
jgi:signal transduction histidine kinase